MQNLVRIALRNVLRNRRRTAITVTAIFVGIGVMVGIRGFVNGLQVSITRNAVEGQTGHLQIHRKGYVETVQATPLALDLAADPALLEKIRSVKGVRAVTPRIVFGGMLAPLEKETLFVLASAIDPASEYQVCGRARENVIAGKALDEAPDGILISSELAASAGLAVGDTLAILTNDKDGVLNALDTKVAGLLVSKIPGDKKFAVVPLKLAQELLRMEGRVTELAVLLDERADLEETAAAMRAALPDDLEVHTWSQLLKLLEDVITMQNFLLNMVSVIFLIVVLTGIVNTMLMAVLERVREIGTMMSLGVRRSQILGMFLAESMAMGLFGGLLGALVGWLAVAYMHHVGFDLAPPGMNVTNIIRPEIGTEELLLSVGLAMLGACLSAVYPAMKASRLRPVEALMHV